MSIIHPELQGNEELEFVPEYEPASKPKTTIVPSEEDEEDEEEGTDDEDDEEEEEEVETGPRKPTVLISGGGIGGLMLALLLYKARVPFLVFERAKEVKPLVGPLFKQLGIFEEFEQLGKRMDHVQMYTEDLKPLKSMNIGHVKDMTGFDQYVISRPALYTLLLRYIPPPRVLLGKRILNFWEDEGGVTIRCSDKTFYRGDILVGADGAYSAVRQRLYQQLKEKKKLPACDDVDLPFSCVCLVGQTARLDPEEFPALQQSDSECSSVLGRESQCTWLTLTTKQNTVCWMVIQFLNKDTEKDNDAFRNSELGWEAADAMASEVMDFKIPGLRNGRPMTLGDYVDMTPLEFTSKVMLEEIVFETWYKGRVVLIGDSCHKMNPTGAVGAAHAIHDAVALANWISTLRRPSVHELEKVFKKYRAERYPIVKEAFASSQMFRRNLGKDMTSAMTRGFIKRMPYWMYRMISKKLFSIRNQVSFLPLVEDNGKVKPRYQASLHKTLRILMEQGGLTNTQILAINSAAATTT
ncbi:hypothetical protein BGZ94_004320 [Podila epigama]|nr:hypothetical protein BGZ94_004320 [Podila epigama]